MEGESIIDTYLDNAMEALSFCAHATVNQTDLSLFRRNTPTPWTWKGKFRIAYYSHYISLASSLLILICCLMSTLLYYVS